MVKRVKSWETCVQLAIAAVVVVVTGDASAKAVPVAPVPDSALARCHSTSTAPPTGAQIDTLQALVLKYKVAASKIAIDKTAMSRCQFASLLSALSDRVNEIIFDGNTTRLLPKEDLFALQHLQEAYAIELRSLSVFDSTSEARTAMLKKEQFSPTTKLSGEWILEPQFNEPPLPPLPPLPSNGNALAAPTDIQALDALTKRHGCIIGFAMHRAYQPRRFEFAAALNACIDRVEQLMAGGTVVSQADLSTLHRLEAAYAGELAHLRRRVAQLEERIRRQEQQQAFEANLLATLKLPAIKFKVASLLEPTLSHIEKKEQQPFSPTTKLHVETVLELSGTAGGNR